MALWIAVHGLANGQDVDADTFNGAVFELAERTDYLYAQLQSIIGSGLFESVKLTSVELDTVDAPAVGDIVYLNPDTNVYTKAIATVRLADVFTVADSAYALGLLAEASGTVVLLGKVPLATNGSPWTLADLVETGETFRTGPYYLSSREAGKITAYPSGIRVYVGHYETTFALLNPQYRDTGEAHVHRAYVLAPQPVGQQTGIDPDTETGVHAVIGFACNVAVQADGVQPQLVCRGTWTGTTAAQYTIWMAKEDGVTPAYNFTDLYLHWTSTDGNEAAGSVRVYSYEAPVTIGSKGLVVSLERSGEAVTWDVPYAMGYAETDDADKRTWVIEAPTATVGWLARRYRQAFESTGTAPDYTFRLVGGPAIYTDARTSDVLKITCTKAGALMGGDAPNFAITDQDDVTLATWTAAAYWIPVTLSNGLQIVVVPYDLAGVAATDHNAGLADAWTTDIVDEAPGAVFEYAIGMHQSLAQQYPPIPVQASTLVLNGVELDSTDMFPANPTYRLGWQTIYWYNDNYGKAPWPTDWVSVAEPYATSYTARNLVLHFVHSAIGSTGSVTSLRAKTGSGLRVKRCGTTDTATVGDLELDFDLALNVTDAGRAGYQVVKAVTGQQMERGAVVERILQGPGIVVTQSSGAPAGQGTVRISLAESAVYTGDFEEVALQNAKQELVGMFPYIRLLPWQSTGTNVPSGFVCKFRVPHTLQTDDQQLFRVVVYATIFGEQDIVDGQKRNAGLEFSYSFLPDYSAYAIGTYPSSTNLRNTDLTSPVHTVNVPFGIVGDALIYSAFDPILIHNSNSEPADEDNRVAKVLGSPFPNANDFPSWPDPTTTLGVRPGSLVAVKIRRCAPLGAAGTYYTGSVGIINLRWMLVGI